MSTTTTTKRDDDLRWLALLIRQGLKLIVTGIETRYGLAEATQAQQREHRRTAHLTADRSNQPEDWTSEPFCYTGGRTTK